MGLATVTWLLAGEVLHTDSLGSAQVIRPGELNLMTAGPGVAHAEDGAGGAPIDGVQLWLAQPARTRWDPPSFVHVDRLPVVDLGAGSASVMVGRFGGVESPASFVHPLIGLDLDVHGAVELPLDPAFEHALLVLHGEVGVADVALHADQLQPLGAGRVVLTLRSSGSARALLLGGAPLDEDLFMWWNFVGRSRDEIETAYRDWRDGSGRFGTVATPLAPMAAPRPAWLGP
jgi:redox-sensitive bicupin YhaK (pirin superfamily)